MGSLFGRKGRTGTGKRRESVAKKSASLLAAVAVAGGSAVVGMPQAEARGWWEIVYFEKIDEQGNPLAGSEWEFEFAGHYQETLEEVLPQIWGDTDTLEPYVGQFRVIDEGVRFFVCGDLVYK